MLRQRLSAQPIPQNLRIQQAYPRKSAAWFTVFAGFVLLGSVFLSTSLQLPLLDSECFPLYRIPPFLGVGGRPVLQLVIDPQIDTHGLHPFG